MPSSQQRDKSRSRLKISVRQQQKFRLLLAVGSAAVITFILILYINLTKTDEMKARDPQTAAGEEWQVDMHVAAVVQQEPQANYRGMNCKPVRPEKTFEAASD